jgi:restriction endonuclease S subunit
MMIPLGEVASVSTAYPFRRKVETEEGGDVAVIQMRNVDVDNAEGKSGPILLRGDGGKYDRYLLREGDLLFQSRGARYPVTVVRAGVHGIAANGLHVIRPAHARLLPEYLAWWLNHPVSQGRLAKDVARGTYIPFVSKRDLEAFLVPLPAAEIQAQIVAVDSLRRRERDLRERLDTLTRQLVDDATFAAAVRTKPGK